MLNERGINLPGVYNTQETQAHVLVIESHPRESSTSRLLYVRANPTRIISLFILILIYTFTLSLLYVWMYVYMYTFIYLFSSLCMYVYIPHQTKITKLTISKIVTVMYFFFSLLLFLFFFFNGNENFYIQI